MKTSGFRKTRRFVKRTESVTAPYVLVADNGSRQEFYVLDVAQMFQRLSGGTLLNLVSDAV